MGLNVDTAAIGGTVKVVKDIADRTTTVRNGLHDIRVRPGNFAEATALRGKVDAGVTAYVTALGKIRDGLEELSDTLDKASKGFEDTERDNNNAAKQDPFAKVWEELGAPPPPPSSGQNSGTDANPSSTKDS
jgi:hypothetical protein